MKSLEIKLPGTPEHEKPTTVKVRKTGGIGSLGFHDAVKGLLIAAIIAGGSTVYKSIQDWLNHLPVNIDWEEVARSSVKGGIAYLTVNVFQKSKVIISAKALIK